MGLHIVLCQNIFVYFNLMPSCGCTQILSNSIKCGIGKPLCKCRHYKWCSHISTYIILKSDIPSKVLQRDLSEGRALLDMNFGCRKHLTVNCKIADRFAYLVNLYLLQIKPFKCISCVSQDSIQFFIFFSFFLPLVLLLLTLVFIMK